MCTDISRPLEEQDGMIIEVNASPGLRMHIEPSSGSPRPVGEAIIDTLFADGQSGRIPIVAVTGTNGKTTTTRFVAHILANVGRRVGMACTDGIYLGSRRIGTGDCSGPQSARAVLANPSVDVAVFETARGGILREGLGFDRCEVAVVTNIGEGDHLGLAGIDTPEQLARVKRTVVDALLPTGTAVLKADDPLVAGMSVRCPAQIIYFARDLRDPILAAHREKGGRAVYVREGEIVAAEGEREVIVASLAKVPLTLGGRIGFQIENTLAATAAAWALGLSRETIRAGPGDFRVRYAARARPIQPAGNQRRHGHCRLRPQCLRVIVLGGSDRMLPQPAPPGRVLGRRRPSRLRHDPPGRIAGRHVRPGDSLRGPLSARPRRGRDHGRSSTKAWQAGSRVSRSDRRFRRDQSR